MKIFLASNAKAVNCLEEISNIVNGFNNKSIVYIPTASNGEISFNSWKNNSDTYTLLKDYEKEKNINLKVLQIEDYLERGFDCMYKELEEFKNVDILWMGGGMPGYLMYFLRRSRLDEYIKKLLNSNTLYVGSSAGSMVASSDLSISEWYIDEIETGVSVIPGLNLVNFLIYPHFVDEIYDRVSNQYYNHKYTIPLYLLKDGEAIIVNDGTIKVLGEERILK